MRRSRRSFLLAVGGTALAMGALAAPALADGGKLDPAPDPRVAQLEVDFLTGMIPHHRSAVGMAQMALAKATHPELRSLAQAIIASQGAEIDQMGHYLRDWYGMAPPTATMMTPAMMQQMAMPMEHGTMPDMAAAMQALAGATGGQFEIMFMSAMAKHHAMAIMMAAPVLTSGWHADLYTLAEDIVISQGQEIRQMDQWLQAWYGVPRPL